jgi:hypothetical protein
MTSLWIFVYLLSLRIIHGVRTTDLVALLGGRNCRLPAQEQMPANLLHVFGHRVLFIPIKENVPAT